MLIQPVNLILHNKIRRTVTDEFPADIRADLRTGADL